MAFVSMFFIMIVFTVVLIGLIIFLIAAIMDIIWIVRSARKKKTHIAVKILAVIMSIVGIGLFVFQGTHLKYCEESQLQAIFDYYHNEAELAAIISYFDDDRNRRECKCDFDKDILFEIRDYYDTKYCDYSGPISNENLDYRIEVKSSDGLFYESISLHEIGDNIVLGSTFSGGEMTGITLPEDKEDYVRSQIREWTDLY